MVGVLVLLSKMVLKDLTKDVTWIPGHKKEQEAQVYQSRKNDMIIHKTDLMKEEVDKDG